MNPTNNCDTDLFLFGSTAWGFPNQIILKTEFFCRKTSIWLSLWYICLQDRGAIFCSYFVKIIFIEGSVHLTVFVVFYIYEKNVLKVLRNLIIVSYCQFLYIILQGVSKLSSSGSPSHTLLLIVSCKTQYLVIFLVSILVVNHYIHLEILWWPGCKVFIFQEPSFSSN